jgi:branched-chain amino acid transport system substrate-binding protein
MHFARKPLQLVFMAVAALAMTAVVGCGSSSKSPSSAGSTSGTAGAAGGSSATGSTIVIGQMTTGATSASPTTTNVPQEVLKAWVDWTNSHGGLSGHPVKLIAMADTAQPGLSESDLQTMINDHVVALVGVDEPATDSSWKSIIDKNNIPVIGGVAYDAPVWSVDPHFYPTGPQVSQDFWGAIWVAKNLGHIQKAGIINPNNGAVSRAGAALAVAAAKDQGVNVVASLLANGTALNYDAECLTIKNNGGQAIIDGGMPLTVLTASCARQGFHPVISFIDSFGISPSLAASDAKDLNGIFSDLTGFPVVQEFPQTATFFQALGQYYPSLVSGNRELLETAVDGGTSNAALAWDGGVALAKAVANAGVAASAPVTSADIIRGLSMFHGETLGGIVAPLTYGNGTVPNIGAPCTFAEEILNGKLIAPRGLQYACNGTP